MEGPVIAVSVAEQSGVAEARRRSVALGERAGFREGDAGRIAVVATELATNLLKHGRGGELLARTFHDLSGAGVEVIAVDKGPGMASVERCLQDGYSTAGSAGQGLGAVKRQSECFEIFSRPEQGTAVLARLQPGRAAEARSPGSSLRWGAVCRPKEGEEVCGDEWDVVADDGRCTLIVADGLGHGPQAAQAAVAAIRPFRKLQGETPATMLAAIHQALRPTRGAAVSIARLDFSRGLVTFAGIGNVAGTLIAGAQARKMISHNGTAGHTARRIQEFEYPFAADPVVVLHSDGLGTGWSMGAYPGLQVAHPSLIAAVLYRDFTRRRDDVTVLVASGTPA